MTLLHFNLKRSHRDVQTALGTNAATGTAVLPMLRVLRSVGLRVGYRPHFTWQELRRALARGAVVIAHVDQDHYVVAHACDSRRVWLADPSVLRCPGRTQSRRRFVERWTRWALVVRAARSSSAKGRN